MRQLVLLSFFLGCITTHTYSQEAEFDCKDLKKGKFMMTGPSGGDIDIRRTKKKQIERYNREKQKYKFSIIWTSDCTYELRLLKSSNKDEIERPTIAVQVIENSRTQYTARISTNNGPPKEVEIFKW